MTFLPTRILPDLVLKLLVFFLNPSVDGGLLLLLLFLLTLLSNDLTRLFRSLFYLESVSIFASITCDIP